MWLYLFLVKNDFFYPPGFPVWIPNFKRNLNILQIKKMLRKIAKLPPPPSHIINLAHWYCDGGVSTYIEGIYYNLFWHKSLTQWIQSPISACVLFWQSAIFGCMESIICFTVDNSLVMVDRRCLRTSLFKAANQTKLN